VINAVVGPVKADKLLEEARWAVDNYQKARDLARNNFYGQANVISLAHLQQGGDKVHKLLAEHPLVPVTAIREEIFEKLAGQKVSHDRGRVMLAAAAFEKAEQKGMPVLLVFGKPQAKPGEWDAATARVLGALAMPPYVKAARYCILDVLPIDELPALTSLVEFSEVRLAERQTPTMILLKPDGTQLASLSPNGDPAEIVRQLWEGVNQCRWEKAERLLTSGKQREAATLLRVLKAAPYAGPLKDQAIERLAELKK
jgi:hypothetical protein